ncbi:hypothetical protein J1605_005451 [Eschrichtius robustus]|uniref:Eukaryotic translation initiation factor 4E n=1 Tax=Eschrichtius robustus TaxID=9764 RepID=A0AB34HAB3_ESCRO|nr:hypothetical protein J1605_005451 [Eschrichtius robustus]
MEGNTAQSQWGALETTWVTLQNGHHDSEGSQVSVFVIGWGLPWDQGPNPCPPHWKADPPNHCATREAHYSLFKDGIEPMWEDEKNERGGRWLITLNKQQRPSDLDRFRLATLLCLTGECFDDYSDDVCGAVVNDRAKGEKIAMWTTECENREAVTHIGRVYKERLGLPPKIVTGYQSHADTATKSGSATKNRFVV